MEILARGVGRRKEAVAQVQIVKGTGQFLINNIPAQQYLHNNTCSILSVKSPLTVLNTTASHTDNNLALAPSSLRSAQVEGAEEAKIKENTKEETTVGLPLSEGLGLSSPNSLSSFENMDTIVKVKGGGLIGQAEAIKLGLARALCDLPNETSNLSTEEIRKQLKDKGYLTQDSRVKERRKYGLKKARKATQYNKR